MNEFSKRSKEQLRSCDHRLVELFNVIVRNYDCTVLEGERGEEKQTAAFENGFSKVQWPNGKHNRTPSMAVDVAPYPINWKDTNRFYHFAGYVKAHAEILGIHVIWGGDWDNDLDFHDQTFYDLVHWQLWEPKTPVIPA